MEKYGEDRVFNTPLCEQVKHLDFENVFYLNFRVSLVSVLDVPWLVLVRLPKFNLLIISSQHSTRWFQGQLGPTNVLTLSFRLSMKQLNIDIEVVPSSTAAVSPLDHHVLLSVMAPSITLNHLRPISHIHPVSKLPSHAALSKPRYTFYSFSRLAVIVCSILIFLYSGSFIVCLWGS